MSKMIAHEDFLYPIPEEKEEVANTLVQGIVWDNYMDEPEDDEEEIYMKIENVMYLKSSWGKEADAIEEDEDLEDREDFEFIKDIATYFSLYGEEVNLTNTFEQALDWQTLEDYFSKLSTDKAAGVEGRTTFAEFEESELEKSVEIKSCMNEEETPSSDQVAPK